MISTRHLSSLPAPSVLRERLQSLAVLDAVLCPDWEFRYYSFNAAWAPGEEMGSMRNGCGDDFFALLNPHGCFLKGFAHESPAASLDLADALYRGVPPEFQTAATEPAFRPRDVTFCLWRSFSEGAWRHNPLALSGDDPDGSASLLSPLDGRPQTYQQWAEEYYECDVDLPAVAAVYSRRSLTSELAATLNPDCEWMLVRRELQEIGYPSG